MRGRSRPALWSALLLAVSLAACGGGGGGGGGGNGGGSGGGNAQGCDGSCPPTALTTDDVRAVIAQAVAQSQALGIRSVIAVVDRVGNVLGVFKMTGAADTVTITSSAPIATGLVGLSVPSAFAAISEAGTGAYLASQGNAFTTRTASQIIQPNFDPQEMDQPGGPLFGVQLSQLPCGDLVTAFPASSRIGPRPLPLGLSGDAGGLPLFKPSPDGQGMVPVGGVGVEADGAYTAEPDISSNGENDEEIAAVGATSAYAAPANRRADRIFVAGRSLLYTDVKNIAPVDAPPFEQLDGMLVAVSGFTDATITPGTVFGTAPSGILATTFAGLDAEILVDASGTPRFPPRAAASPGGLSEAEVTSILKNGLLVASRARAQIRQPLGSNARVTISVVDLDGSILGIVRTPDAPVFGTDVSLQKARTAVFLSSATAADQLTAAATPSYAGAQPIGDYVTQTRALLGDPTAFTGQTAFADRSIGNLARPFFPDGINANANGPLSKPIAQWSPFSTGLQLDLDYNALAEVLDNRAPARCTDPPQTANGIQIFAGSVPVYRGAQLIGAVGVSGDGIDQDDMIAFLALNDAALETGTIANAPRDIRADRISVSGVFLRYVNCPVQPFLDSDTQDACDGL
jgi:uncharacterized protein GlcG (DUF336 family)